MHWTKLRGIVFLIALIAIWEIASRSDLLNPLILPAPARILGVFSDLISSGQIPWQILVSMKRAAARAVRSTRSLPTAPAATAKR